MPVVFRERGYRVYFYSYDCNERMHVHVDKAGNSAKFWLDEDASLFENINYSQVEIREIRRLIVAHLEEIRDEWARHCA